MQAEIVNTISDTNLVVFGLAKNETPIAWLENYVTQKNISFDMLHSADDVFNLYGVHFEPTYIIIDKMGQIRFRDGDYYYNRNNELITIINEELNN